MEAPEEGDATRKPDVPAEATHDRSKQNAYAPIIARLQPPKAASVAEERRRRKERLPRGLRIFSALGFAEGVADHITARGGSRGLGAARCFRLRDPRPDSCSSIGDRRGGAHPLALRLAWSAVGWLLDPITQAASAFFVEHTFFDDTKVPITEAAEGASLLRAPSGRKAASFATTASSPQRSGGLCRRAALSGAVPARVDLQTFQIDPESARDALPEGAPAVERIQGESLWVDRPGTA
jgi:hypothetical protein